MILTPAILCLTLLCAQDDRRVPGSDELMTNLHFSVVDARHVQLDINLGNTGQRRLELTMPEGTPFGIGDAGAGLLLAEEVQVVIEPGKIWQKQVRAIPIGKISVTEGVAGPSDLARIESALDQFAGVMELAKSCRTAASVLPGLST